MGLRSGMVLVFAILATTLVADTAAAQLAAPQFGFRTIYHPGSGPERVQYHRTAPGVPTPLEVDGDPSPDLVGLVVPSGPNELRVVVRRAPGQDALRVQVTVVVSMRGMPREHVHVGYDARPGGAPEQWGATVQAPIAAALAGVGDAHRVTVTWSSDAREIMAIVGGLFDGPPSAADAELGNPMDGRVTYRPMGTGGTVSLNFPERAFGLQVVNSDRAVASLVTADARVLVPHQVEQLTANARVSPLEPRGGSLAFDLVETAPDQRRLTLDASQPTSLGFAASMRRGIGFLPLTMSGSVDRVPRGRTVVVQTPARVDYTAPEDAPRLDRFALEAHGLRGGPDAPGDFEVSATQVPRAFTLFTGPEGDVTRMGLSAERSGQSFGSIDFRAWRGTAPSRAPTHRNVVEVTRRAAPPFFSARGHLEDVVRALVTKSGAATTVGLGFGSAAPRPLSWNVTFDPFPHSLQSTGSIDRPPQSLDVGIHETEGPRIEVRPSRTIPQADVRFATFERGFRRPSVGAALRLANVPPLDFCASAKPHLCDPDAPRLLREGDRTLALTSDLNAYLRPLVAGDQRMRIDGMICLGDEGVHATACMLAPLPPGSARGTGKGLILKDVRLRDLDFEFATGESEEAPESDLVKLWMHTVSGAKFDQIRFIDATHQAQSDPSTDVRLANTGESLTADRALRLLDITPEPNVRVADGRLTCGGLRIRARLPVLGMTWIPRLPFLCGSF